MSAQIVIIYNFIKIQMNHELDVFIPRLTWRNNVSESLRKFARGRIMRKRNSSKDKVATITALWKADPPCAERKVWPALIVEGL